MRRFFLTDPVSKCYDRIDKNTIELKSGFLGLCADIDRYFKFAFDIDLNIPVACYHSDAFLDIFPNLSNMTHSQLEQLRNLYCEIRNINAHLYLSKPIYISTEMVDYLSNIAKPQFDISSDGELTMFGMTYVLMFICQKYQTWTFLSECFKSKFFIDIPQKNLDKTLHEYSHYFHTFCGKGKPILCYENVEANISNGELVFFNDTCKRYMTKIFFDLEKSILGWLFSSQGASSFSYLLKQNQPFATETEITNDLIRLRNCWFHGWALYDKITDERGTFTFSLDYIVSIFNKLKTILPKNAKYSHTIKLIEQFGERLIHFYVLRIVEVSYKLLDSRLLTEDKLDERIMNVNFSVERMEQAPPQYFDKAIALMQKDEVSYDVHACRFLDSLPRTTKAQTLQIIKIASTDYITIGDYQSNKKEVCIALIDLDSEYLNKINGISPFELQGQDETYYSSGICVKNVVI